MSYAPRTRVACPNLQTRLIDFYETCDPALLRTPAPFNDFIWSDTNRGGIQQLLNPPGTNKLRTGIMTYDQRLLESNVKARDMTVNVCASTEKRGNLSTSYSIDPTDGLQADQLFNSNDWIYACQNDDDVIVKEVQKLIDVLYAKVATRMTQRAAALIANWDKTVYTAANTVTEGSVKYLKIKTIKTGTTEDRNPLAVEQIDFAIEQTQFCAPPVIFSGRTLSEYYRTMLAGCCSQQGIALDDMLSLYGKAVMYDRRVQTFAGGVDYAWVIQPKAMQPVYYTANNDQFKSAIRRLTGASTFEGADYWKTVLRDPESGMPFDFTVKDNCGDLSVILSGAYDLKAMPLDMFAPGDDMEGVRFVAGLKVVNS